MVLSISSALAPLRNFKRAQACTRAILGASRSPQVTARFYSDSGVSHQNAPSHVRDENSPSRHIDESILTNHASPATQPLEGRRVMDYAESLSSTDNEGVRTIHDSTPDPALYSMKNNDNPNFPSNIHARLQAVNGADFNNSPLMMNYYKNAPKSMDADYAPSKIPSGYKDQESGVVYYDPADKFLNTIPMRGLEDKFVNPDLLPPVEVHASIVPCDGTNHVTEDLKVLRKSELDPRLGHPRVYVKLDRLHETKRCPYCGVKYKRVPHERLEATPLDAKQMPEEGDDWYVEAIKKVKGLRTPH